MEKCTATVNLTTVTNDLMASEADNLGLTKSSYLESVMITQFFENGFVPNDEEIENLRTGFLVNKNSNVTGVFRKQILTFPKDAQAIIIEFIYKLNLIKDFRMNTTRMANFFKGEEICYFALGKIGRRQLYVSEYLESSSLKIGVIGNPIAPADEYLFFSNYEKFSKKKPYPKFTVFLQRLGLPKDTAVVKVHYSQLLVILDVLSNI